MKKVFLFITMAALISCGSKTKTDYPMEGEENIPAIYTLSDSSRTFEPLARTITVIPEIDSITKKPTGRVLIDTLWDIVRFLPMKDALGKAIVDSATKKPKLEKRYFHRPKDSVRWKIENISWDTLMKKNAPTH